MNDFKEFYLATQEKGEFTIFTSDIYKFTEIDVLNMIKICLIDRRSKLLGDKILKIYEDSVNEKTAIERLKGIGINNEKKQTKRRNPKVL